MSEIKGKHSNSAAFRKGVRPIRILPLGYLSIIVLGTLLLMLPAASREGSLSFFDALFTATSASCVTGLVVVDTGTHFTLFGQAVILMLIQLGGLGFMTLTTVLFSVMGRRFSLKGKLTAAESLGEDGLGNISGLCRRAAGYTFVCEGVGAAFLFVRFANDFGPLRGCGMPFFTAFPPFATRASI